MINEVILMIENIEFKNLEEVKIFLDKTEWLILSYRNTERLICGSLIALEIPLMFYFSSISPWAGLIWLVSIGILAAILIRSELWTKKKLTKVWRLRKKIELAEKLKGGKHE